MATHNQTATRVQAGLYVQLTEDSRTAYLVTQTHHEEFGNVWAVQHIRTDRAHNGLQMTVLLERNDDGTINQISGDPDDWQHAMSDEHGNEPFGPIHWAWTKQQAVNDIAAGNVPR